MAEDFQTPMLQQYAKIKERYPDALLFFRLGDFYELFFDDAKIGSTVMNITLTKRSRGADGDVPMCGVPFHAADNYISKLVTAGYKVAIAEQLTDPKETKGLVEREVIRVITPGTVVSEKILEKKENNFLLCVDIKKQNLGLSFADVGTGGFWVYETSFTSLEKDLGVILKQLQPRELLLPPLLYENAAILKMIKLEEGINVYRLGSFDAWSKNAVQTLTEHFGIKSLSAFGVENAEYPLALPAAAALLTYLKDTQKNNLPHITKLTPYSTKSYLRLDSATMTNLEIFKTVRSQGKRGSLINLIDKTMTAMGGRLLRSWLRQPLTDLQTIEDRQAAVNTLLQNTSGRQVLIERLGEIVDIERLISRLSLGVGTPRDLDSLRLCLQESGKIASFLASDLPSIKDKLSQNLTTILDPLAQYLSATIIENPPLSTKEGGFIQKGVSTELDSLRELLSGDTKWLSELQVRERQKTGIENLKINSNKVYGYYIEVSKSNLASVPDYYIRKQTLVNAERFIIPELKERENQVFEAEDRINKLELQLFQTTVKKVLEFLPALQQLSTKLAGLDCLTSFAVLAFEQNYQKPQVMEGGDFMIKDGRHPVVESLLQDTQFVPNDTKINDRDSLLLLITGPNMSGKSTYLRQVALIVLLAQMGSFVPASQATIPLCDQIFTRVGASDSLAEGQSTFLVEMMETANILHNATPKSLVVFDEIGRGTSTFDGMSIAWAVIEYLLSRPNKRPKTLFATHYHELTVLSDKYPEIHNMQMAVAKEKGEIVFLRKVIDGAEWESYGIEVAKLAGLPQPVIKRAQEILYRLKANQKNLRVNAKKTSDETGQMKLV